MDLLGLMPMHNFFFFFSKTQKGFLYLEWFCFSLAILRPIVLKRSFSKGKKSSHGRPSVLLLGRISVLLRFLPQYSWPGTAVPTRAMCERPTWMDSICF